MSDIYDKNRMSSELNRFMFDIHKTASDHGFWDTPQKLSDFSDLQFSSAIALVGTELSEALEAKRKGKDDGYIAEELGDAIIRILDLAEAYKLDVVRAMIEKSEHNKAREFLHGKRF